MNNDIETLRFDSTSARARRDYEKAFDLRNKVIEQGEADVKDYYFLAELNMARNEYQQAEEMLTKCIELGEQSSKEWFASSVYILRAYALIKLNKIDKALSDIAHIEKNFEEISITWLQRHGLPIIDLDLLKKMV